MAQFPHDERPDHQVAAAARVSAAKGFHSTAAYALFGMLNWIYNWYDPDGAVSPAALAAQFSHIYLRGVAPHTTAGTH
ncbi:MAG TPA: hypothetical protein VGA22_09375 [Gemmatimonadales bacterium]|jgi:hypothetical protein